MSDASTSYTSVQMYARLLQHPALKGGEDQPPSLQEFESWDPQKQDENLSAFRHLNPGIFLEAQAGRKIKGTIVVVDRDDRIEGRITHNEIEWGEPLDIQ